MPIGVADIKRAGTDLTVVAWSNMVHTALEAAERWPGEGVSVEVVDLRTISPLDTRTILESVRHTGRLLVVHEAVRTGGFGAEIAAVVAEQPARSAQGSRLAARNGRHRAARQHGPRGAARSPTRRPSFAGSAPSWKGSEA